MGRAESWERLEKEGIKEGRELGNSLGEFTKKFNVFHEHDSAMALGINGEWITAISYIFVKITDKFYEPVFPASVTALQDFCMLV